MERIQSGVLSTFGALSCVQFSKVKPLVFAAASSDGFIYIHDIGSPSSAPIATLEAPSETSSEAGEQYAANRRNAANKKRVGFTSVAFNKKQRDFIAACDYSGKVHIWHMGWRYANKTPSEQAVLDAMGNIVIDEMDK